MIPYKGKNRLKQYIPKKPKSGVLKYWHGVELVESPMIFTCTKGKVPMSITAVATKLEIL